MKFLSVATLLLLVLNFSKLAWSQDENYELLDEGVIAVSEIPAHQHLNEINDFEQRVVALENRGRDWLTVVASAIFAAASAYLFSQLSTFQERKRRNLDIQQECRLVDFVEEEHGLIQESLNEFINQSKWNVQTLKEKVINLRCSSLMSLGASTEWEALDRLRSESHVELNNISLISATPQRPAHIPPEVAQRVFDLYDEINRYELAAKRAEHYCSKLAAINVIPWIHRISAALWSNQVEVGGPLPVPSFALPTKVKQRWDTDN